MHAKITFIFLLSFTFMTFQKSAKAQVSNKSDTSKVRKISSVRKRGLTRKNSGLDSDQLLRAAKLAAFKQNNYPKAKSYLYTAMKKSPKYSDIQIFLGRIYGWTGNYDSARYFFTKVLSRDPKNEDAAIAYSDLEYNLDHFDEAKGVIDNGLKYHKNSKDLFSRKKRITLASKNPTAAKTLDRTAPTITLPAKTNSTVTDAKTDSSTLNTAPPGNEPLTKLLDASGNQPPVTKEKPLIEKVDLELVNQPPTTKQRVVNAPVVSGSNIAQPTSNPVLDTSSSDDLLVLARKAAFDEKNYEKAKGLLYRAYNKSPEYTDIQIFLGRIYTWTNNYDSAQYFFESAARLKPDYEDATSAYTDLEYFNDHYVRALGIVESGLRFHPQSEDLLLRKAKVLTAMKQYKDANDVVNQLIKINRKSAAALELHDKLRILSAKNDIAFGYDFAYFNKQFPDPWHLFSAEYGRVTDLGKIIGRINFANRFHSNSAQFEFDAYPHISKTFYAYINAGFPLDGKVGIFPKFRSGLSLYANLPASFEAEIGVRYLQFNTSPVFIYTASLGKYIKNWLFTERIYMVPSDFSRTISLSFSVTASYYIGGESADNVIGGSFGYGSSPDDRAQGILAIQRLNSYHFSVFYKKKISKFDVLSFSEGTYVNEYLPGIHGNEFDFSVGVTHSF